MGKNRQLTVLVFVLFYELKKTGMPLLRKKNKVVDKHQNLALGSIKLLNFRSMSITNIQTKKKKEEQEEEGRKEEGRRRRKTKKQASLKQLQIARSSGRVCRLQGKGCDSPSGQCCNVTIFADCWIFIFKLRGNDKCLGFC